MRRAFAQTMLVLSLFGLAAFFPQVADATKVLPLGYCVCWAHSPVALDTEIVSVNGNITEHRILEVEGATSLQAGDVVQSLAQESDQIGARWILLDSGEAWHRERFSQVSDEGTIGCDNLSVTDVLELLVSENCSERYVQKACPQGEATPNAICQPSTPDVDWFGCGCSGSGAASFLALLPLLLRRRRR